jgi:RNA 3'-terminal phosphate cyclase (ATP)
MIEIDGSLGEGGGQILRSALTLSLMTKQDFRVVNIRSKRKEPGLRPQHLKAVQAAAKVSEASVEGAKIGSQHIFFSPGDIKAGNYRFDIGTAGSASLVFQTLMLPLSTALASSTVSIRGGTHVPWSPCFHYLDLNYLPFIWKLGLDAHLRMVKAGFYPRGGGELRAAIEPTKNLLPMNMMDRGRLLEIRGISSVSKLSRNIAIRQRRQVIGRLGRRFPLNDIRIVEFPALSPGSLILLLAEFEHSLVCYFALGQKGKSADKVADQAIREFEDFIATDGVIDQYMADQLLLPLAFAVGPSKFRTSKITRHLTTNAEVIRAFLPVKIHILGRINEPGIVSVTP